MKLKEKFGIFLAAVLLTLVGFSAIAAPTVDMLQTCDQSNYRIVAGYLVEVEAVAPRT